MTSLHLLRTLPLLYNGFLSHRHQINIAAVWFLSHRHLSPRSQLLLRTLPLLRNGFLSQCHQVNIAAVRHWRYGFFLTVIVLKNHNCTRIILQGKIVPQRQSIRHRLLVT
ncbi:unnamed protein product, partial [Brassica rapa]